MSWSCCTHYSSIREHLQPTANRASRSAPVMLQRRNKQQQVVTYRCPKHPQVTSTNRATKCYICAAEYKAAAEAAQRAEAARRAAEAQRAVAAAAQRVAAAQQALAVRQANAAAQQAAVAQHAQYAAHNQVAAANRQIHAANQARGVAMVARNHVAFKRRS